MIEVERAKLPVIKQIAASCARIADAIEHSNKTSSNIETILANVQVCYCRVHSQHFTAEELAGVSLPDTL